MQEFGFKELYSVILKTTYPIEINGISFEEGEVIASFDKIQISNFSEIKDFVAARGGFNNEARVVWETTKELQFSLTQGIFSKVQFALMSNSKLITTSSTSDILISQRDNLESDEQGNITFTRQPVGKVYIYNTDGSKILSTWSNRKTQNIGLPYTNCVADYKFNYQSGSTEMIVGQALTRGFLTLEGRTRVKDDITGQTKTGIIYIPKLKLMSDLSMRLGENATPIVGRLDATAYPTGPRGQTRVMEMYFLNNDIDSDM